MGKSGGGEDRFDEIEFNLQPPNYPAVEPLDEMEPDIIVENNPHVMESEEKPESAEECDSGEERNRTAREGQSGSQGALAGHKLDKEVRG